VISLEPGLMPRGRITSYLSTTNVQLGATYGISRAATAAFTKGYEAAAEFINAGLDEVCSLTLVAVVCSDSITSGLPRYINNSAHSCTTFRPRSSSNPAMSWCSRS
jgi:hypothetical protein